MSVFLGKQKKIPIIINQSSRFIYFERSKITSAGPDVMLLKKKMSHEFNINERVHSPNHINIYIDFDFSSEGR